MLAGDQPGVSLADRRDGGQSQSVERPGPQADTSPSVLFQLVRRFGWVMPLLVLFDQIRLQDSPQFLQFFLVLKQFVEPRAKRLEYQEGK